MSHQKGISLYITIIVLSILLSIVFGLSAILSNQVKMIRNIEKSVIALHAADAGIERALIDIIHNDSTPQGSYQYNLDNGSDYTVTVVCCDWSVGGNCVWTESNPCPLGVSNPACNGYKYCVKSLGVYAGTTRALWVDI